MDEKEILDYCIDRELQVDATPEECDLCKETSILVEPCDINYRNHSFDEPNFMPLCIYCYCEYIIRPMDDQWYDYYRGLL